MSQFGVWRLQGSTLQKVEPSTVDLEAKLESWIETDPSLLQSGLTIVGRQVTLDANRLDLLGLDIQGGWVVIEIKRGTLRRDSIAQALDYASQIDRLPAEQLRQIADGYLRARGQSIDALLAQRHVTLDEEREVSIFIVGTGTDPALDRIVQYLDGYELPITVVSFGVFALPDGTQILVREVADSEQPSRPPSPSRAGVTVEDVARLADSAGTGNLFRQFLPVAADLGLYARPWKSSVMFTPPSKHNRTLFTVWAQPEKGLLSTYIGVKPFSEFFGVPAEEVVRHLGEEGFRRLGEPEVQAFLRGLKDLFAAIRSLQGSTDQQSVASSV